MKITTEFITSSARIKIKGHESACIWFTGLSGSGKSTLAAGVEKELNNMGIHTFILDGDVIRRGLNKDLGFSIEDRSENIRRIGEVSKLFTNAGLIVLTAFISPFKKDRETVRALHDKNKFIEVYVDCNLKVCADRDVKGLYKKARAGEIKEFTGISSPYEIPDSPEIRIKNGNGSDLNKNIQMIVDYLKVNNIITKSIH